MKGTGEPVLMDRRRAVEPEKESDVKAFGEVDRERRLAELRPDIRLRRELRRERPANGIGELDVRRWRRCLEGACGDLGKRPLVEIAAAPQPLDLAAEIFEELRSPRLVSVQWQMPPLGPQVRQVRRTVF